MRSLLVIGLTMAVASSAQAAITHRKARAGKVAASTEAGSPVTAEAVPSGRVRYKDSKVMKFDGSQIQGALQRPETMIVTGDETEAGAGLIRLRSHFLDRQFAEMGLDVDDAQIEKVKTTKKGASQP